MESVVYAPSSPGWGTQLPKVGNAADRSRFGDVVLVGFMIAQALDGVFTYLGVSLYGSAVEANPLVSSLMAYWGHGPGVALAKALAVLLGIVLHFHRVHRAVAFLTCFYLAAAVLPWVAILFF